MALDPVTEINGWPVNSAGEIVFKKGSGNNNVVGVLPANFIPADTLSGKIAAVFEGVGGGSPTAGTRAVLVGDSNTQLNYDISYISSLSRTNGVATVVLTGPAYFLFPGCPVQLVNVPDSFAGVKTLVSCNDATNTYTFANPGPDEVATLTSIPCMSNLAKFMDNGWFVWSNILSNQRFDLAGVVASFGRATSEMLARVGEAAAMDASVAFVMGGTNDVMGGLSSASIIANLKGIYEALVASGKKVYALTILPLGAGNGSYTAARTATITVVNSWIKQYCRSTPGMQAIDVFGAIVDPMGTSKGRAATGMINGTDGLHLTQKGAFAIGKLVRDETANVTRSEFRTSSNADNYGTSTSNSNILDNAPWSATGGSISGANTTGVVGLGYAGSQLAGATVAFSAPLRADGFGYNTKADISAAAANDGARIVTNSTIATARIPAGSTLQADISVNVAGNAGKYKSAVFAVVSAIGSSTVFISGLGASVNTAAESVSEDWSGIIRTPAVKLPVALTSNPAMRLDTTLNAAGTLSIEAGRAQILVTQ